MICFLNSPFVIMLSLYSGLLLPLMIYCIFLILFVCKLGKFFLILRTFLVLLIKEEVVAWVYNFIFSFDWLIFLKYLEISLTFLGDFAEIKGGNLLMLTGQHFAIATFWSIWSIDFWYKLSYNFVSEGTTITVSN